MKTVSNCQIPLHFPLDLCHPWYSLPPEEDDDDNGGGGDAGGDDDNDINKSE